MEITRSMIEGLTCEDIALILDYKKLLSETKADVKAITEIYRFRIGEDKITIWKNEHDAEYLTYDGVWQARYLHQTYDLPVTVDSVFNAYKAWYKKQKNPGGLVDNLADSASYFRSFAQKARKLMDQLHPGWADDLRRLCDSYENNT